MPYILLVIVSAVIYLPFYVRLPSDVRIRFTAAGLLYVGGAIGLEMVGSIEASANDLETWTYTLLYSVEELFEMLGAVLFIDSAMVYLTRHSGPLSISILESGDAPLPDERLLSQHSKPETTASDAPKTASSEDSYSRHQC